MQVFDRASPFAPRLLVVIAIGGAIGASGRWFTSWVMETTGGIHQPGAWPWATLVVNVLGCSLIGIAARRYDRNTVAWAFAATGVLGGFTTFSALAVELNDMADAERLPLALLYGAVTLAAGIGATALADAPSRRRGQPRRDGRR